MKMIHNKGDWLIRVADLLIRTERTNTQTLEHVHTHANTNLQPVCHSHTGDSRASAAPSILHLATGSPVLLHEIFWLAGSALLPLITLVPAAIWLCPYEGNTN